MYGRMKMVDGKRQIMSKTDKILRRERLRWIRETLGMFGFVNAHNVVNKFGVSYQQATRDLVKYQRENLHTVRHNFKRNRYEAVR